MILYDILWTRNKWILFWWLIPRKLFWKTEGWWSILNKFCENRSPWSSIWRNLLFNISSRAKINALHYHFNKIKPNQLKLSLPMIPFSSEELIKLHLRFLFRMNCKMLIKTISLLTIFNWMEVKCIILLKNLLIKLCTRLWKIALVHSNKTFF